MLQQRGPLPELSTTDPLTPIARHKISGGGRGKAAAALSGCAGSGLAELQRLTGAGQGVLQPETTVAIHRLPAAQLWLHHQRVCELTVMQHGPAATGTSHQFHAGGAPVVRPALLMTSEREGWSAPSVEPQHRWPTAQQLLQHPAIDRHLDATRRRERRNPAPEQGGAQPGSGMLVTPCRGTPCHGTCCRCCRWGC